MWRVIGQDESVRLLTESIKKNCLAHAYLFSGPAHTGKMTLATELARAVNCVGRDAPCGECAPCRRIESGQHADVRIINLTTGIEPGEKPRTDISIRVFREDILKQVALPPFEGKYRVYIIEDASTLSGEAANCFLKTLEEPLGPVLFLLLAASAASLPSTVVSRCQTVNIRPLPLPKLEAFLTEKYGIPIPAARLIAHFSHGATGRAITAAADEMVLEEYSQSVRQIVEFLTSGYETRLAFGTTLAAQFARHNGVTEEFLDILLDFWRDLMLVKIGTDAVITNVNILDELREKAALLTLQQIRHFLSGIAAARQQLLLNVSPRMVLDCLMLDMPSPAYHSARS